MNDNNLNRRRAVVENITLYITFTVYYGSLMSCYKPTNQQLNQLSIFRREMLWSENTDEQ